MPPKQKPPTAPNLDAVAKAEPKAAPAPVAGPEVVEPTAEETELADRHGITVDALRALRADLGAAVAAVETGVAKAAAFCGLCLPGGWPDGADHMDCPHGTWKR